MCRLFYAAQRDAVTKRISSTDPRQRFWLPVFQRARYVGELSTNGGGWGFAAAADHEQPQRGLQLQAASAYSEVSFSEGDRWWSTWLRSWKKRNVLSVTKSFSKKKTQAENDRNKNNALQKIRHLRSLGTSLRHYKVSPGSWDARLFWKQISNLIFAYSARIKECQHTRRINWYDLVW